MDNAFRLFRFRGIDVLVHVTFPLILIWAGLAYGVFEGRGVGGAVFGVLVTLLLFGIVLLHEFGHSLAAQAFGVEVKRIILLPLGGVAQLGRIPENPLQEFVIAIAGPAVNFLLAILMIWALPLESGGLSLQTLRNLLGNSSGLNAAAVLNYLFVSNLFLAIFNLAPAFPLDGGRVLRALLAAQMGYVRATRIAVGIGQSLAWALGLWGFISGNLFGILIAVFIYVGAQQEGQMIMVRSALGNLTVNEAYSRRAVAVTPHQTVGEVAQIVLQSSQSNFAVCEGSKVVGMLSYPRLVRALESDGKNQLIGTVMHPDVVGVHPEDRLFVVQQKMLEANQEAFPVIADGAYLGLITRGDLGEAVRLLAALKEAG
ncbi:MAG: site-2 protease family protein [Chloroflexi bacterium]|nr:site-2 protease family protein [Chloroflexota bacterium]